jgi:hypothetical protein
MNKHEVNWQLKTQGQTVIDATKNDDIQNSEQCINKGQGQFQCKMRVCVRVCVRVCLCERERV